MNFKSPQPLSTPCLILACTPLVAAGAFADVIKADNTTALNVAGSYTDGVLPLSSDLLIIDNTLTAARTANLGDDLSILGLTASAGSTFTLGATSGKTLTIGAGGINKSGTAELVLNSATTLGGDITMPVTSTGRITFGGALNLTTMQTWALGINRINVNNKLDTGSNPLSITGGNGSIIRFGGSNTIGPDVTITTTGGMFLDPGAGTLKFTGTNNTNASASLFTGTLEITSMGNLTGASSIGKGSLQLRARSTVNFTGTSETSNKGMVRDTNSGTTLGDTTLNVTNTGETLTMTGNFTHQGSSQTGAWIFGGPGNLILRGAIQNGADTRITKKDEGTLTLAGANTYAGATNVTGGTLALGANDTLPDTTDITLGAAVLNAATFTDVANALDVTDMATINLGIGGSLVFADSTSMPWAGTLRITGTFVSGSSLNFGPGGLTADQLLKISAAGFTDFALDASGFLIAISGAGYSSWAAINGAGAIPGDDHDADGVPNAVEYFIGGPAGNTTGFTPLPGVTTGATRSVTWVKGPGYTGNYSTGFVVQSSPDLAVGNWTTETPGVNVTLSGNNVTYTFPAGTERTFVRLKVTGP